MGIAPAADLHIRGATISVVFAIIIALVSAVGALAADAPAMVVPGQFNVGASGAFSYTIPIAIPPGTAGMVPALSLDYSSQSGDGPEGVGWSLSGIPAITRCPRTIAQDQGVHGGVNFDTNDRFCLGGQRLILISTDKSYGADGAEYRTEINGFSRIISHGTPGTTATWFQVWTKSGQIMEFGNTTDSKQPLLVAPVSAAGTGGTGGNGGGGGGGGSNTNGITVH